MDIVQHFDIINASVDEEKTIRYIVTYIAEHYTDKLDINKLATVEVVDALPNDSSGRAVGNKILLARKNGLELIKYDSILDVQVNDDVKVRMILSTIYHELWHVTTWDKYHEMCEYIIKDENDKDMFLVFAYMYWIEYIAHIETVFMEVTEVMKEFCESFVRHNWHKIEGGYGGFLKALPYYLVRAKYLNIFDELTQNIKCDELRIATYEFDNVSEELFYNSGLTDMEKASIIKDMIVKLFE